MAKETSVDTEVVVSGELTAIGRELRNAKKQVADREKEHAATFQALQAAQAILNKVQTAWNVKFKQYGDVLMGVGEPVPLNTPPKPV